MACGADGRGMAGCVEKELLRGAFWVTVRAVTRSARAFFAEMGLASGTQSCYTILAVVSLRVSLCHVCYNRYLLKNRYPCFGKPDLILPDVPASQEIWN